MSEKIPVNVAEVKRVYELMEKLQEFFHQPENFLRVNEFARETYPEIREIYYEVMWEWLPDEVKQEYDKR